MDAAVGYRPGVAAWRIGETIGRGAVGRVVRVYRDGDDAPLAGKILHASHESDAAAAARFQQEARIAAALEHPNIVRVFGIEAIDGNDVLLMEYVDGPTLARHIACEAPLPEDEIVALARGIAAGLEHAHAHGVVHRDLKPANVLLAAGGPHTEARMQPKIGDFGMARGSSQGSDDAGALALAVLGTPDYMAPECLDPLAIDGRADLYALGCIVFEMATGRPPFVGATPHAVLRAHRDEDVPALPDALSPGLATLVRALLAKSPGQRPQAARTVVDALDRIARGDAGALALRADDQSMRCALCNTPLVAGVGACLSCGQSLLRRETGDVSVVVVGPGEIGDKIDSELRERLCRWLASQPDLGLDATKALAKQIPRLPFTLAGGLGEAHARAIAAALAELGIVVETTSRHPLMLAPMRRKAATMSGRVGIVALTSSAGLLGSGPGLISALVVTVGLVLGTTLFTARRVTRSSKRAAALPPALDLAIGRTVAALPAVTSARHRDVLRAMVERATALVREPELANDPAIAAELARAVDAATVAAATLERLDRELVGPRLGGETMAARDRLQSRDLWASRLQAVLAELDAIAARLASARGSSRASAAGEELALLRAQVEALEEVQA